MQQDEARLDGLLRIRMRGVGDILPYDTGWIASPLVLPVARGVFCCGQQLAEG